MINLALIGQAVSEKKMFEIVNDEFDYTAFVKNILISKVGKLRQVIINNH